MALGGRRVLGMAMGDREILLAELRATPRGHAISHTAAFAIPADTSPEKPAELGAALRVLLASGGFKARQVVIGLPAMWLMARRQAAPAVPADALAGVLRLQAERLFAVDPRELAVDYAAEAAREPGGAVLLVATMRRRVEGAIALAHAAGLRVAGVTASSMALSLAQGDDEEPRYTVAVQPDAMELTIGRRGSVSGIQHVALGTLGAGDAGVEVISGELRRVLAGVAEADTSGGEARLTVWDGVGLSGEDVAAVGRRLMLGDAQRGELAMLADLNGLARSGDTGGRYGAAVALGRAAVDRRLMAVDFLHSRLASVKRSRLSDRRMRVPALLTAVLVLAGGWLAIDWRQQAGEIEELAATQAARKTEVRSAAELVAKVGRAEAWFTQRPRSIDMLRALTQTFPEEGIWATNISLRDDMQGQVTGRARDQQVILQTVRAMRQSPMIQEVKLVGMREAGRDSREQSFTIGFRFLPGKEQGR